MNMLTQIKTSSVKAGAIVVTAMTLLVGGCGIFGGGDDHLAKREAAEEVYQIGVNAYLWRASLETLEFMPLITADQQGGVIVTDWSSSPYNQFEKSKVDVRIVGRKLSADALKVSVFRQIKVDGQWQDARPRTGAEVDITNAILMQARIYRRDNAEIK